jgi:hypothetical protein
VIKTGNLKPQMHAARPAATKERFKPDLPKRLAALREKGSLKISFRFEKNLTVSSTESRNKIWDADARGSR